MFDHEIEELKGTFGEIATVQRGDTFLVRLASVLLPAGCKPDRTAVLLVLSGSNRPGIHIKPGVLGPHGGPPRSCSEVLVEGEPWLQFSYQFPWEWGRDSLVKFVGTALRRFAKHE